MHAKSTSTRFEKHCLSRVPHLYLDAFLPMNLSRVINGFFAVLFTAIALWAVAFFVQMHRELKALRAQEESNRKRLAAAEAKLREQEQYLERLRRDPALVERVIREKLGYAKGDEFVFRFQEEPK